MKNKGITLISLVVTIIVLIIISGVVIYLGLSDKGIFTKAKQAKENTNKQTATEIINLKITNCQMNKYAEKQEMPNLQELANVLCEDKEIQYVALESKVANSEKIIVGDKTSIFTKLKQYPYEFEINSSLQLASINGEKIIENNNEINKFNVLESITITGTLGATKAQDHTLNFSREYKEEDNVKLILGSLKPDMVLYIYANTFTNNIHGTTYTTRIYNPHTSTKTYTLVFYLVKGLNIE